MEVIGIIGVFGMGMGVAVNGYNSGKSSQDLRDAIDSMNTKIGQYKSNYIDLLNSASTENQKLVNEMASSIDDITTYSKQMDIAKNDHAASYKMIQRIGVALILYIIFIFILKIFGFYDIVQEVIVYPFKKVLGEK